MQGLYKQSSANQGSVNIAQPIRAQYQGHLQIMGKILSGLVLDRRERLCKPTEKALIIPKSFAELGMC